MIVAPPRIMPIAEKVMHARPIPAALQIHAHVDVVYEDLLPDGAAGARLDRLGKIYNVIRKPATAAEGEDILRLVGDAGSTFTSGAQLAHEDGTLYQLTESGTIPAGGYADVSIGALDTGSGTRKQAGQVLTFLTAPAGIESAAELQADLDQGGEDEESDGAYSVRILDKIRAPGMGGNAHDYVVWAMQVAGVDSAYCYPTRQGLGTVDVAALHSGRGTARLLTSLQNAALQAYIDTVRPVSVADFRVLTVSAEPVDVEVTLAPLTSVYAYDWDDITPPVVSSYTPASRVLKFTAARPLDMIVGDRLVYVSTAEPFGDGSELVVETLGPGADEVTLKALTSAQAAAPPVAGNKVYSGGPLVEPARQALLELMDTFGPARGDSAYGAWEDTLRISSIYREVTIPPGSGETVIIAPSGNVRPANEAPNDTIGLLVPRQIVVRRGGAV